MKKKQLIFILLATAGVFSVFSQGRFKLEQSKYIYLDGDNIYKYQASYKEPGPVGKGLQWDFTDVEASGEQYTINYFWPEENDTSLICGMEHDTRYYYLQQNDSIWSTGFENYTTRMNYGSPELKLKFPFQYGDTLYSTFQGEGMYCNLFPLKVKGWTRVQADAEGELRLPGGITVPNALRTHTTRYYTETGKDSIQMILETYTWYAQNLRYPVFESIKTTLHNNRQQQELQDGEAKNADSAIYYTSFYYTPAELKEAQSETKDSTDIDGNPIPEAAKIFTEARMLPSPVVTNLNIDYRLTRTASVWFSVHSNSGLIVCQTTPQTLDEGYHQAQMPMGGLITGAYTVCVHVDNMLIQRTIIKK
jgi:hypothetical protein